MFKIHKYYLKETGNALTPAGLIDTSRIGWIRMGTTVGNKKILNF